MRKALEWIPTEYWEEASRPGRLEKLYYETVDYFHAGKKLRKHAWVYLPPEYQKGERYLSMYFMHGAGTNLDEWIFPAGQPFAFKNVLDHMIENGDIQPVIFVFPTYYQGEYNEKNCNKDTDIGLAEYFPTELRQDLIPAVETGYLNLTSDYSAFSLRKKRADRERRIFGGFSMGAVTTWNVFAECMDLFSIFCPLSGDCWRAEWMGGSKKSAETAALLAEAIENSGYEDSDYRIYCVTGERDIALKAMSMQIEEMYRLNHLFHKNNLQFDIAENGLHNYDYGFLYLYHFLKDING